MSSLPSFRGAFPSTPSSRARFLTTALAATLIVSGCSFAAPRAEPNGQSLAAAGQPTATARAGQAASQPRSADRPEVAGVQTQPGASGSNSAVAVYRASGSSVVNITSLAVVRSQPGAAAQAQPQGTGSGFIIDRDGRIVTNNHVVQDADQLAVTFQNKTTVPAKLVGRDPDNDLAVIIVDPNATDDSGKPIRDLLKPVTLGDSDQIEIGEDAVAIGSPLGLQQTVTAGIVSALRQPGEDAAPGQSLDLLGGAVQTDAAINPGNSGGPLFNAAGEVIGVNSAILSQSGGNIGIGFAIPINVVKRVAPELINSGCYHHPLIGVTTISLSQFGTALKEQLGIPTNQKGLMVVEVGAGAAQAGLRAGSRTVSLDGQPLRVGGDIITVVDGHQVATQGDLRAYVENSKRPGETIGIAAVRDGQPQQFTVTLSQRPSDQPCR